MPEFARIGHMPLDPIIKLPGAIDVHVHLREPGATQKEDFETGTRAAVAGGYTQVLDMPNNNPPTVSLSALGQKINLTKNRVWCDIGFNFGATSQSVKDFKKVYKKTFGLKVYMNQTTGPLLIDNTIHRDFIFKSWQSPLPIMVHAEGETVEAAIKLAKKYKKALHVCHVTADQIRPIEKAKLADVKITCEVSPHHLFLTKIDVKKLGPLALMKPPLLDEKGRQKLWDNIAKIDMIATDHAPHTIEEKKSVTPPFGVPGLETTLPLMLNAVSKRWLTLERLIEMTSQNPRETFKLPTQNNTYILIDTKPVYEISNKNLFTKCAWTPFLGMEGRGKIKKVVIRGKTVFENGNFISKPQGRIIFPSI